MNNPDTLLSNVLDTLRDIADFVGTVDGDTTRIYAYDNRVGDLFSAIQQMKAGTAMIAYMRTDIIPRSNGIGHYYSVFLAPRRGESAGSMFWALREGVVSSTGQKFKRYEFAGCHPPDVNGCQLQTIIIGDGVAHPYYEIPIRITERGVDS